MIIFKEIELNNIVTYQKQALSVEEGVTVITGQNGAGKSLLFSCIGNNLYFSHPLSEKKDAKSLLNASLQENKDFIIEDSDYDTKSKKKKGEKRESSITLLIQNNKNNKPYKITQKSQGDSVSYSIEEDGKDLECRTIALAKEQIEKICPIPEDIFYTCSYLSSYKPHPLLHGTTSQRYEFFEN
jgi:DNA repair exonuclease SbcCD ATPase subunit